uniref:Uncharacterized protein n=1 Tax=Timema douglasi TaxID=61478 RepID=A0A7R8VRF3_TIMDO|nr:unnamed protein product [Timema douglasi]
MVAAWSKTSPLQYTRLPMAGRSLLESGCTEVVLLLDEPTWDLDPLNTYLVISILSNHARKYGRAVVLTMEKPRSDVFPFLDRVTYLCLGDVVYTGATRLMLHYFRSIGFPCPELENPLMYYLCLSTVDRRSRERFIESNHQIAALVEKFKLEGGPFRKSSAVKHEGLMMENPDNLDSGGASRVPLSAFGHPGSFNVAVSLYMRYMESSFNFRPVGLTQMALRLLALPIFYLLLWIFYSGMEVAHTDVLGMWKFEFRGSAPTLVWRESGKPYSVRMTRIRNLDLPSISSPANCESDA